MDATMQLWQHDWLSSGRSEATLKTMSSELKRFEGWLGKPILTATVGDCLGYMAFRRESVSVLASEMAWRSLRSFFAYVTELDGTPNPMAKVKCPKRAEPAVKGVAIDELAKILATCSSRAEVDARDRAIIMLLSSTGLRRAELANLKLDDVNTEQSVLLVRTSKSGKPRVVPFDEDTKVAVLKWLRVRDRLPLSDPSSSALFIGRKGPLGGDGIRLMLERRSKRAGVKVGAHMFRRTFAVDWLSNGGSQVSLMNIAGWSTSTMPARYTRHAAEQVAESEYRRIRS